MTLLVLLVWLVIFGGLHGLSGAGVSGLLGVGLSA